MIESTTKSAKAAVTPWNFLLSGCYWEE
jgi:hypothetical protein